MGELLVVRRDKSEHTILFDDVDADTVAGYTWHVDGSEKRRTYYARSGYGLLMHNVLLGIKGVDHINHNGLDNRRCNLRPANQKMNGGNSRPNKQAKSSVYKGVWYYAKVGRWRAEIRDGGPRQRILGEFRTEWAAAEAYNEAAAAAWGEFACLNVRVEGR